MTKSEWTTEEVLQDITKQLENKEKNIDLLRTRIRSKIRRIEKLCTSNKKLHEENTKLKENIHSMLFTDDVVQDRYDKCKAENRKLKKLLKEVVKMTNVYEKIQAASNIDCIEYYKLIKKINQVLGEE